MKIFILDSDMNDIESLKSIIQGNDLGLIVGETSDPLEALEEVVTVVPDLLLMDLIHNKTTGFNVMEEIVRKEIKTKFIVISDSYSKEIVEKVYRHKAEFFIHKPINDLKLKP